MTRKALLAAVAALALLAAAAIPSAQAASPFFGTWKLNVAKSTIQGPPPRSQTVTYEGAGEGIKVTVHAESSTGEMTGFTYTANYDGKDNPVTPAVPGRDTTARTSINANTQMIVNKVKGTITTAQTLVVSSDGRTLTMQDMGTDEQGEPVNTTTVWDKQ